jgi:hypothetical protein
MPRARKPAADVHPAARPEPMSTAFLLLAQYGGGAVIPISLVCRD